MTTEKKYYTMKFNNKEFFMIINSLFKVRQLNDKDKKSYEMYTKLIDKFDEKYFKRRSRRLIF